MEMTTPPKAEEILAIARHTEHNIGVCDCVNGLSIEQQIMEIVQSYANAVSEQRVSSLQSEVAALLELCSQYKDSGKADKMKWMQLEKDLKEVKQNRDYYQGVVYKKAVIENIRNEALEEAANEVRSFVFENGESVHLLAIADKIESLKREPR